MNRARVLIVSFAMALAASSPAFGVDDQAVDGCHRAVMRGLESVARGRIAVIQRCLKADKYDGSCTANGPRVEYHENELRSRVTGSDSACQAALASGASVSDFGPLTCGDEWADCDAVVPSITTLEDLAECLICQERGFDLEILDALGVPRPAPPDNDERRCTRRIAKLVGSTVRRSIFDTDVCAEDHTKPFSCPVDASDATHFGQALATFPDKIAGCGLDDGKAPGVLTNICGGTAADSAQLAECLADLTECLACRTANNALGQSEDCAAFSGFADCDGMF